MSHSLRSGNSKPETTWPMPYRNWKEGRVSTDEPALGLDARVAEERVARAADALASGAGVVLLWRLLALRPNGKELLCEVLDPTPSRHRCSYEYEVLIENAQRALEA